jgi:SWI/SNF-related matrix-associated actin-dependent regulator 1 of chromatin subfamily A
VILLSLYSTSSYAILARPSAYSEAVRQVMFDIPGVNWNLAEGAYEGAPEAIAIGVERMQAARVAKVLDKRERGRELGEALWSPTHLRDYQKEGVVRVCRMLHTTRGALLCDEMGLGKSAQALITASYFTNVVWVICPAVVVRHWKQQAARWAPQLDVRPIGYEKFRDAMVDGAPDYSCSLQDVLGLRKPGLIILDEIHYLSNSRSKRSRAVRAYLASFPDILRLGLSGTPMTARPRDLWHPLDLLWPERWGREFAFQKRYCEGHYEEIKGLDQAVWKSDGKSNEEELGARLKTCMVRRLKSEVGAELPSLSRQVVEVEVPPEARDMFNRAQLAVDVTGSYGDAISSILSTIEEHKLGEAMSLAQDALAGGSRVLVLTTRKSSARSLGTQLEAPYVHGEVAPEKRRDRIADAECAIATIDSVQVGIDLIGFDVVIFVGLDWLPSKLLQAEARVHRLGAAKAKPITVYYLVAVETVEEVVRDRVIERLHTFGQIVGELDGAFEGDLRGGDSEEELLAAIVRRLSA